MKGIYIIYVFVFISILNNKFHQIDIVFIFRITLVASIFLIVASGVERYLAVCRPHHYHRVTYHTKMEFCLELDIYLEFFNKNVLNIKLNICKTFLPQEKETFIKSQHGDKIFSRDQELSMKDTAYHMMRSWPGLSHSRFYRPFVLIVVVLLHNYWKTDMVNNYVSDVEFRVLSLVVSVLLFSFI